MPETTSPDASLGRRTILPLPPAPLIGYVIKVLAVLLIAYSTDRALEARQQAGESVTHTMQVLERAQQLLTLLIDAETGQRGFVLTREEATSSPITMPVTPCRRGCRSCAISQRTTPNSAVASTS